MSHGTGQPARGASRGRTRLAGPVALALCLTGLPGLVPLPGGLTLGPSAHAQGIDPENRPVAEVRLEGLREVPEALVRNQVRQQVGDPYSAEVVNADISRLTRLGRFGAVTARVEPREDGSLTLIYRFDEQPTLADVSIEGNKAIPTDELRAVVVLRAGDPADPFLIQRAQRQIETVYQQQGYFIADVTVDERALAEDRRLVFQVREGPRVTVRDVRFEGNQAFRDAELRKEVKQETYHWLLRSGDLDRDLLRLDEARLRDYLQQRGYLDAQADARIDIDPTQQNALVTFTILEGPRYVVEAVRFEAADGQPLRFTDEQLLLAMDLRPGAVFSEDKLRRSEQAIQDLYGRLGYLYNTGPGRVQSVGLNTARLFDPDQPRVTLAVRINEGVPSTVGKVFVRGNSITQDKVVRRQVRGLTPGRPFDVPGVNETRRRLNEGALFRDSTVTILGDDADPVRDVLIDVNERNTGSVSFGASVSSDLGVGGAVEVVQRNFDLFDPPDSLADFVSGRSFRGAGQNFRLSLSPGVQNSTYSVNWADPAFLESDYTLDVAGFFTQRDRDEYDEQRLGGSLGLGRRFGDVWSGSVRARYTGVDIADIPDDAPVDVFDVEGGNTLTALGLNLKRSTADSLINPSRGSVIELSLERAGALGGDFDFTRVETGYTQFWTVDEDFLGRRTTVMGKVSTGYIFEAGEAPVFERFFAGGRTFRGFGFRGIGPIGIRNDTGLPGDDKVGGEWVLLTTLQYEFPLFDRALRGVVFTDQGTVTNDFGADDWRVTVGFGFRLTIDFLSQAPFALDFAVPVIDQDTDDAQLISFTLDIPFR